MVLVWVNAQLLNEIEILAKNHPFLSTGVGTRNYYRKLGYELEGPYMVKGLAWCFVNCINFNKDLQCAFII